MPVSLSCPICGQKNPLKEPLPLPGHSVPCCGCSTEMAVTYPPGVMNQLKERGKTFMPEPDARRPLAEPSIPSHPSGGRVRATRAEQSATAAQPERVLFPESYLPSDPPTAASEPETRVDATRVDATRVQATPVGGPSYRRPQHADSQTFDRTVPSSRTPYGNLPGNVAEPEGSALSESTDAQAMYEPTHMDLEVPDFAAATLPPASPPRKSRLGVLARLMGSAPSGCAGKLAVLIGLTALFGFLSGLSLIHI